MATPEKFAEQNPKLQDDSLKNILNNTLSTIEENKTQIFDIYETARTEVETSRKLLEDLKKQTRRTIDRVDALIAEEQVQKQKLVQVSSNFANYSEEAIRESYEAVKNVQVALGVEREKEAGLRQQRDKLEMRLRHLQVMHKQAEHLALAIGSVLSYLSTQIGDVMWRIEEAQKDKFVGAKIIKAQEDERYRISREMHDGPAQDLANLIFQTSVCEKLVDNAPDEAKQNIRELRQQIRECLTGIRKVIFDMRPMALDDLGLAAALHQLCDKMAERGILLTEYSVDGNEYGLPKHVEIAAFRIVQEALNNVAHHAKVKQARVRLLFSNAALSVLVEDNGKGFDPDAIGRTEEVAGDETDGEKKTDQLGILSMRERAKIIGADFMLTSAPGRGTKVHLRIPNRLPPEKGSHKP